MKHVIIAFIAALLIIAGCTTAEIKTPIARDSVLDVQQANTQSPGNQEVKTAETPPVITPVEEAKPSATPTKAEGISLDALSLHTTESDCWVGYKSKAYDITGFIRQHPGGKDALIRLCGTSDQFEKAFTTKHGTSKVSVLLEKTEYKGELNV